MTDRDTQQQAKTYTGSRGTRAHTDTKADTYIHIHRKKNTGRHIHKKTHTDAGAKTTYTHKHT